MNRRGFLCGALAASSLAVSSRSRAAVAGLGGGVQRAYVTRPQVIRQNCPQWCWAASMSMVFEMWGHTVDQRDIVQATFGTLTCQPIGSGIAIARTLSGHHWVDSAGNRFRCTVSAAYDFHAGFNNLTNDLVVRELSNDRPLIYCNTHHAMVQVTMDYRDYFGTIQPLSVGVLDPWPQSPAYHPLTPAELIAAHLGGDMTFLATVDVH